MLFPKGPKYQYGTKYGFCSSNFPYGLGKYSPYEYLGPFGLVEGAGCSLHRLKPSLMSALYGSVGSLPVGSGYKVIPKGFRV